MLLSDVDQPVQIDHIEMWVGRRFGNQQPGIVLDGVFQRLKITHRHDRAAHTEPLEKGQAEFAGAAVAVVGDDDMRASREHGQQDRGDGRHPRRKQQGGRRAFQCGQPAFRGRHGRISVAAVFAAAAVLLAPHTGFHKSDQVGRIFKSIRGRLHHGFGDGVIGIGPAGAVDRKRRWPRTGCTDGQRGGRFDDCGSV